MEEHLDRSREPQNRSCGQRVDGLPVPPVGVPRVLSTTMGPLRDHDWTCLVDGPTRGPGGFNPKSPRDRNWGNYWRKGTFRKRVREGWKGNEEERGNGVPLHFGGEMGLD